MAKYENPVKLAIFESTGKYSYQVIYTPDEAEHSGYARVSEWVEVSFPPRDAEEALQEKITCLDKEMEAIRKEALEKLNKLQERRQELLAIPFDSQSNAAESNPFDDIPL